jgi:RHS repeat-associated protein
MTVKNISKQCRLASALVIICFSVAKAAAYEPDYYIDQHPPGNNPGLIMDVAVNDVNHPDPSLLRVLDTPTNGGIAQPFNGVIQYLANSGFYGFDTFRYDYGTFSEVTRVWISVIPDDKATDAGEGCTGSVNSSVGQPVNVTNGNMWLKQQDYLLPGFGAPIEITRAYNSITQANGIFGSGWTSQYDDALTIFSGGKMLRLRSADGRAAYFGRLSTTDPFTSFSPHITASIAVQPDSSYTLTYKDGRKTNFSPAGRLTWLRDRNGNQTTLNYDVNGILTGITDAAGRILTISSNANGNVTQISDATSIVATYEYYPSTNRLKTVTYNDGSKYQFEYDTTTVPGKVLLTTVKDALNNILETHAYDPQGRATTSERHGGVEKYTLAYNQTDPTHGAFTNVTDANGDVSKYILTRQSATNLITRIDGACGCSGGSQVTTFEYDTNKSWLNLIKTTDALGCPTTYSYDNNRNVTGIMGFLGTQTFTYNAFGEVLKYRDRVDSQNLDPNVATVTNTYDANGNLLTSKDALGFVTTLAYPATNNKGLPDSIKDARNNITKFKWFATGSLQEVEDPYGKKTNFTYDARARIDTITNALGHVTDYNYFDDTQRKVEMIYPNLDKITYRYDIRRTLESMTDERGKITNYEFDPQYRLKKITDPLTQVKEFGYDLMSNMTSYKDPLGNITDYRYDAFDRLKETEYPAASVGATRLIEKFEYDTVGRIKKITDTANRDTNYAYDDVNRINTVTNPELETTTTKYNQRLQTFEVKDAINQVYTFSYDPLGRLLSQTRAGGTMTFAYDAVGNRKKRTDYSGRITHYTYDNLNRLQTITYGDPVTAGAPPNLQATYGYDDISRLTSAVNENGTVTFGYDNRNRVTSATDVFNQALVYEYERTPTVNQKRLKLNGALYATYNYDNAERLSNIVNAVDSTTIDYTYFNDDTVQTRTYPNGVSTSYAYDNMRRLTRSTDNGPSGTLFDRQYGYNTANQIGQITEPSLTRIFTYDNVNRLRTVSNGGSGENYLYDDVGKRTSSHLSSTYAYQPFNKVTSTQTATYGYDANGNMTTKGEGSNLWRYGFDHENRMAEAATRKQKVRYKYDALGRRVSRNLGSGKESTKFTYDGDDVLLDDNFGTLTKYLNGEGIDNKLRTQSGSDPKYFLADHLGSTNGLTDSTGALTSQTAYDSFGNRTASLTTRYGFTGRERDDFTGLIYYRARFYDPNLGRFISEDPIGFGGGDINLYGYVGNSPLMSRDPSGKIPPLIVGGAVVLTLILTSPSYVNAPGPRDPVYFPNNPLLANAAGGAACGYLLTSVKK